MRQSENKIDMTVESTVGEIAGNISLGFVDKSQNSSSGLFEALTKESGSASFLNRRNYEKRLLTFQASTYYAKPACLSPLFCARFGWQNADKNMLVCSACGSALSITLNSNLSANTFDRLCQAYRNKIVSCHATSCPFRLSSIDELRSFELSEQESENIEKENSNGDVHLSVPIYLGQVLPEDTIRLMEHPSPYMVLKRKIDNFNDIVRSINSKAAGSSLLSSTWRFPRLQVPSKIRQMNSSMNLTEVLGCDDESILALSLLGWTPISNECLDNSTPVLSLGCRCCFSIIDLQLENSSEDNDGTEIDRLTKRQKISYRNLNPLESHRHYCPYKVGFPEKVGDSNPVWKIILQRLCEEIHGSKTKESARIEEIEADVAIGILEKSVDNVRKILHSGIATRKLDLKA